MIVAQIRLDGINDDGTVALSIAYPDGRRQATMLNVLQILNIDIQPKTSTPGEAGSVPGFKAL